MLEILRFSPIRSVLMNANRVVFDSYLSNLEGQLRENRERSLYKIKWASIFV